MIQTKDKYPQNDKDLLTVLGPQTKPTQIGTELDSQYWIDRVQRIKPSPKEMLQRALALRTEKEARFKEALYDWIEAKIGKGYGKEHQSRWGEYESEIQTHIACLFETGIGSCYSGGVGAGKTHVLLEYAYQLGWREWEEYIKTNDYPQASDFIEKTVHFGYAVQISESFEKKEKISYARYNLIDDLGVEADSPYIQSKWDDYFEEINRRGLSLVISTNLKKSQLANIDQYNRIYSRLLAKCRFYELPAIDYRDPKSKQ